MRAVTRLLVGGRGGLGRVAELACGVLDRQVLREDGVQEVGVVCLGALLLLVRRAAGREGERRADGGAGGGDHAAAGDAGGVGAAAHGWEKIP